MRIRFKARIFLIVGALSLLALYLCIDFSVHINVKEADNQRTPTKKKAWQRCQQNITAANITEFNSFPHGMKDVLYYRHCRHFPILLDVPGKCGGVDKSVDVLLLLIIKSSPQHYEHREAIRKTWAQERLVNGGWIRRIFIMGTSGVGFEKQRWNKLLEWEHHQYNDLLQWDFNDKLYNLSLKQVLFLEWMERNCPNARFILNGDDDIFTNTDKVVIYLQGLKDNDGSKHLFTGHVMPDNRPFRSTESKYYIPVQVYESELYPPFCSGVGYLLSGYTASVIYNTSKSMTIFPLDDVFIGMCLAKAGLGLVDHMGVKTIGTYSFRSQLSKFDLCYFKDALLVHGFLPAQLYLIWPRIHDPDLECGD